MLESTSLTRELFLLWLTIRILLPGILYLHKKMPRPGAAFLFFIWSEEP